MIHVKHSRSYTNGQSLVDLDFLGIYSHMIVSQKVYNPSSESKNQTIDFYVN